MIDPAAVAARHPRLPGHSTTRWALSVLSLLYSPKKEARIPASELNEMVSLGPAILVRLRQRGIGGRMEDYGRDLRRFESDLARGEHADPARFPIVSVPSSAAIDWRTGGLQIKSRTFIVAYERGEPMFISRDPRTRTVVKITMKQMRLLHRTWQGWPAVLPSMLFTVLWHWPVRE